MNFFRFFTKRYIYASLVAVFLTVFVVYTLLDAFVIIKVYSGAAITPAPRSSTQANSSVSPQHTEGGDKTSEPIITEYSYQNQNINIQVEKYREHNSNFYVADIKIVSASCLKTAFAKDTFGKHITQTTSKNAWNHRAVFAVNGDYYGFRDDGLIIRNGLLYRDAPRSFPHNEALAITNTGEFKIIKEGEKSGYDFLNEGIVQTFSFGPTLVENGTARDTNNIQENALVPVGDNPRTAIGMIEPLHYIFIVVDGRTGDSVGMSLSELADEFVKWGCITAYNLDGGGSATMYLNKKVLNFPADGQVTGERKISDILYFDGKK